jgi:polyisoprenoid-binding protein YceI
MLLRKFGQALSIAAVAVVLASCVATSTDRATLPPATVESATTGVEAAKPGGLGAVYAQLAHEGGKSFTLDPKTSTVRIYAFRAGKMARLGHNHVLAAPQFDGYFHLPEAGTSSARFDLEFRLDQLEIDNPLYRATLGKAFASVLTPEAIEGTRQHMLGESNMQADLFPYVRIHSLQITGEAPKFAAKIQVEMHGQTREIWVPLNVEGLPDALSVSGAFVLRQTDFGVKPYSVMGGMLAVQDEVVIEFQLRGA